MSPEIVAESSTRYARETTRAEWLWRIVAIGLIGSLLMMPIGVMADEPTPGTTIEFDIPQQRADLALTQFAEQANLTLLFPFDGVRNRTANALTGEYTLDEAIEVLLAGTGLTPTFKNALVLDIAIDSDPTLDEDSMNTKKKAGVVAVLAGVLAGVVQAQEPTVTETEIQTSVVTGTVTDARTGAKLKGAKVTVVETGQTTNTDSLGQYKLQRLSPGDYTLGVSYLGYAATAETIHLRSGLPVSQSFALNSEIEELVVWGSRSARALALNQQKSALNSTVVLSSDFLGAFEGDTISEILRRAPGIAFEQDPDTGDGTNIIVRGLEPDLTTIKFNGLRLPESSGEGRSADLSTLLADSIDSITINRSLLASHDGTGTGALIEIETKGPLDRPELFASFGAKHSIRDLEDNDSTLYSAVLSRTFGDQGNFGLSGSIQYRSVEQNTLNYSVSNLFPGQYFPLDGNGNPIPFEFFLDPRENVFPFESQVDSYVQIGSIYGNNDSTIDNLTGTITAQWSLDDHTELRLDYTKTESDRETARRTASFATFSRSILVPIDELGGEERYARVWRDAFVVPDDGAPLPRASIRRLFRGETRTDEIEVLSFRGTSSPANWSIDYGLGYTKGSRSTETYSLDTDSVTLFLDDYQNLITEEALVNTVGNYYRTPFPFRSGDQLPRPLLNESGFALFNSTDNVAPNGYELGNVAGENERFTAKIDVEYSPSLAFVDALRAGVFYEKNENSDQRYTSLQASFSELTVSDIGLGDFDDSLFGFVGDGSGFLTAGRDDLSEFRSRFASIASSFPDEISVVTNTGPGEADRRTKNTEKNAAAYVEGKFSTENLEVVAGVRYEEVVVDAVNPQRVTIRNDDGSPNEEAVADLPPVVEQSGERDNWLPRISARYDVNNNLTLRGSFYGTVARPPLSSLGNTLAITFDPRELFGPNGNQPLLSVVTADPSLKPASIDNYDVSIAYYFDDVGLLELSLFYKEFSNLPRSVVNEEFSDIVDVELPDIPELRNLPDNIYVSGVTTTNSDEDAEIRGVELAGEKQLTELPGALSGIGVFGNVTYTESERTVERRFFGPNGLESFDTRVAFDSDPTWSGTLGLTYNTSNIDASISYTAQDRRLNFYNDYGLSSYMDSDDSLDFRFAYRWNIGSTELRAFISGSDILSSEGDPDVLSAIGGEGSTPKGYTNGNYLGGRRITFGLNGSF